MKIQNAEDAQIAKTIINTLSETLAETDDIPAGFLSVKDRDVEALLLEIRNKRDQLTRELDQYQKQVKEEMLKSSIVPGTILRARVGDGISFWTERYLKIVGADENLEEITYDVLEITSGDFINGVFLRKQDSTSLEGVVASGFDFKESENQEELKKLWDKYEKLLNEQ